MTSLTKLVKTRVVYSGIHPNFSMCACFISVQLTIEVQDLGSPPRSSVKTITIALENIDDNTPVFNEVQAITV